MGCWCMKCMFQIYNSPELLFIDCFVCFETKHIQDLFFNMAVWITVHLECQNVLFQEGHLFPGFSAYYNLKYFIFIFLYLISSCDMYRVIYCYKYRAFDLHKNCTTHYSLSISNSKALFKFWGFDIINICCMP